MYLSFFQAAEFYSLKSSKVRGSYNQITLVKGRKNNMRTKRILSIMTLK